MGKVYDALQRAEQQRAERAQRSEGPGAAALPSLPSEAPAAGFHPAPDEPPAKRSFWDRARKRPVAPVRESGGDLNKRRIALLQPDSAAAEQFRTLRARIDSIAASQPVRTLAVTSAMAGDGKTLSAISLAVVSSMKVGARVLLMDSDLRNPRVHSSLGVQVDAGLAEVLEGRAELSDAIKRVAGTQLDVLPVRSQPENPAELLASDALDRLLEEVAGRYERIVLDLPPVLGLPDAKEVSERCDGILFVVRADATPGADVSAALEVLDRRRVLGLILNCESAGESSRYAYK